MFPSILTFNFDQMLEWFWTFWGPNGLFLGVGVGFKTVLGSTHLAEQLLFSILPSIKMFDLGFHPKYF